jgi:hypothetical protein
MSLVISYKILPPRGGERESWLLSAVARCPHSRAQDKEQYIEIKITWLTAQMNPHTIVSFLLLVRASKAGTLKNTSLK